VTARETKAPRPEDEKRAELLHAPAGWCWIRADGFCHACGQPDVWQESYASEDYYHGCSVTCHSCGADRCCEGKLERSA
jgi:hypothetical protein